MEGVSPGLTHMRIKSCRVLSATPLPPLLRSSSFCGVKPRASYMLSLDTLLRPPKMLLFFFFFQKCFLKISIRQNVSILVNDVITPIYLVKDSPLTLCTSHRMTKLPKDAVCVSASPGSGPSCSFLQLSHWVSHPIHRVGLSSLADLLSPALRAPLNPECTGMPSKQGLALIPCCGNP